MTLARRLATVALAAVTMAAFVVVLVVVPSTPASAFMQKPQVIKEGPPSSTTYPGIKGSYGGTAAVTWTPSGCGDEDNTAPAQATCDRVPLDIVRPDIDEADDWYVVIEVTWTPTERADNDAQDAQVNDIDIFFYDDGQVEQRNDPESGTFTRMAASETSKQPEVIKTFAPDLGRYNLVVQNFSGVNVDYTVTGRIIVGKFDKPFEALGPVARESSGDEDAPGPTDYSSDELRPTASRATSDDEIAYAAVPTTTPVLGDVAVLPDDEFAAFGGEGSFADRLRPQLPPGLETALPPLRSPSDVPPVIIGFWLVVVPAALIGAAWVALLRRRPSFGLT